MTEFVAETANQQAASQVVAENAQVQPAASAPQAAPRGPVYKPPVDVYETAEEVVIVAAVPGAAVDGIDVHLEDGVLTLRASVPARECKGKYLLREYGVGDYQRTFQVGERIDPAGVSAEYEDGVVRIHLPKAEAAKPRKIAVKSAS